MFFSFLVVRTKSGKGWERVGKFSAKLVPRVLSLPHARTNRSLREPWERGWFSTSVFGDVTAHCRVQDWSSCEHLGTRLGFHNWSARKSKNILPHLFLSPAVNQWVNKWVEHYKGINPWTIYAWSIVKSKQVKDQDCQDNRYITYKNSTNYQHSCLEGFVFFSNS